MRKQSLEVLRPLGQLVIVGNASGEEDVLHSYNQIWFSNKQFAGFTLGGYSDSNPVETGKAAREALGMLARKEIHAEIQGVYPLENAAEALSSFGREEHGRKTGFENISPTCCVLLEWKE